jgi:hypothetical protein
MKFYLKELGWNKVESRNKKGSENCWRNGQNHPYPLEQIFGVGIQYYVTLSHKNELRTHKKQSIISPNKKKTAC